MFNIRYSLFIPCFLLLMIAACAEDKAVNRKKVEALQQLGMAHAAQQEWPEALRSYGYAQELAREMGTVAIEGNALIAQAAVQVQIGDLAEASVLCRQARGHIGELEDRLGIAELGKEDRKPGEEGQDDPYAGINCLATSFPQHGHRQ